MAPVIANSEQTIYIIRNRLIKTYISNYKAMSSTSSKTPPALSQSKTYEDWLNCFRIWCLYTELPKKCQGLALVLSLEEEAQEVVLEIPESDIASENCVDFMTNHHNRLY